MTHRTPLALALAVALLGGGCGTIHNLKQPTVAPPDAPTAPVCRAYGGVRGDWPVIWDYPLSQTKEYVDYVLIPLWATVDLAFSAFADTFTLPYTAAAELRRALDRPAKEPVAEFTPVVVSESPVPIPTTPAPGPLPANFPTYSSSVGK
jgi:uncharacterized protein YceK